MALGLSAEYMQQGVISTPQFIKDNPFIEDHLYTAFGAAMGTYTLMLLLTLFSGRRTTGQSIIGGLIMFSLLGLDEIGDAFKYGGGFDYGDMKYGSGAIIWQAFIARLGGRNRSSVV